MLAVMTPASARPGHPGSGPVPVNPQAALVAAHRPPLCPGYRGDVPLSSHVPDLAALELFVAVARYGSIGAAARSAFGSMHATTPGAMNRAIVSM